MVVDTHKTKGKFYSVILWQQIWIATGLDKMLSYPATHFFPFFQIAAREPHFRDKKYHILTMRDKTFSILLYVVSAKPFPSPCRGLWANLPLFPAHYELWAVGSLSLSLWLTSAQKAQARLAS